MSKITKQNVGGTDYTMVGCALTGVCASAADTFIKAVTLSDGDEISDGMTVIVTFANGNTAGTAPASKTIYSSDQVNYYEDTGLTIPFTLAPAGCYTITYTGEGNVYTYISYPVIQIGNVTGVLCDASGNTVSGSLWTKGAQIGIMFKDGKFLLISGALLNNMSALPTDAVLHYSFDEVPDYPDGTAVYFRNKNFDTSGITVRNGTLSVSEGKLKAQLSTGNGLYWYVSGVNLSNCVGKIIKFRIFIHDTDTSRDTSHFRVTFNAVVNTFTVKRDQWVEGTAIIADDSTASSTTPCSFGARFFSESTDNYIIFEALYVGDGSYATPVIDNANGQNNGINNGGLAVKGVSGKGAYFIAGKYSQCDFNLTPNFTISIWVNPSDNVSGKSRNIVHKTNQLILRNGAGFGDYLQVYLYGDSSTLLNGADFGSLLPPNVWTHVVIIRSGLEFSLYKNGVKIRTIALADNTLQQNTEKFKVANEANTGNQSVDDLLVFNRALSEAEVMALYLNRGNTPKYYPPVSIPASKIPLPPSTDGNYKLRCTVSDGVPSYSWGGTVKGETVRNLGGVQTYTITLPVNLSSSANVYRVLKGCLCLGELETACFEITYGQRPNDNVSVPNVSFMSSSLTMTYNQADRTITFSSTTKFFYACIYSIQEIESYLGLPLTFV